MLLCLITPNIIIAHRTEYPPLWFIIKKAHEAAELAGEEDTFWRSVAAFVNTANKNSDEPWALRAWFEA